MKMICRLLPSRTVLGTLTFSITLAAVLVLPETAEGQLFRRLRARRQAVFAPQPSAAPGRLPAPPVQRPSVQPNAGQNPAARYKTGQTPGSVQPEPKLAAPAKSAPGSTKSAPDKSDESQTDSAKTDHSSSSGRSILLGGDKPEATDTDNKNKEASDRQVLNKQPVAARPSMGLDVYSGQQFSSGVAVAKIRPESLADEAGIRVGDVIVAIDTQRVRSPGDVATFLQSKILGEKVRVQFLRGNQLFFTFVPLVNALPGETGLASGRRRPSAEEPSLAQAQVRLPDRFQTATVSGQSAGAASVGYDNTDDVNAIKQSAGKFSDQRRLGLMVEDPEGIRGVVVREVREKTLAQVSGIQSGDRIISVNGRVVSSSDTLRNEVSSQRIGDPFELGIVRNGQLIRKNIDFSLDPSQVAQSDAGKANADSPAGGLASGIGSVLGGLFGSSTGQTSSSQPEQPQQNAVEQAGFSQPAEQPKSQPAQTAKKPAVTDGIEDDELAFGDDEPVGPTVFDKLPSGSSNK